MISTHILDLNLGKPAIGVRVRLEKEQNDGWKSIADETTNNDGRIAFQTPSAGGVYRLNFAIDAYFKSLGQEPFFISAPVVFHITDTNRKYHIPLLLSPFGYSTYRGS